MNHLEKRLEEAERRIERSLVNRLTISRFHEFKIPGAIIVPEEFVYTHQSVRDPELGIMILYSLDSAAEFRAEPVNGNGAGFRLCNGTIYSPALYKPV